MPIFQDTFTAGADGDLSAHTPDIGTSWTKVFGDSGIEFIRVVAATDRATGTLGASVGVLYSADATYPSADYECYWTYVSALVGDDVAYLFVRLTDVDNFYAVRIAAGTSTSRIYKKVSGTFTALGTAFDGPTATDVVKLQVIGSTIKVFYNTTQKDSVTDTDITATGKAGVGMGGGAELVTSTDDIGSTEFDDFNVSDLGGGGSSIKTFNGLAYASTKTVNGLAIASVKTFNGLA